MKLKNKNNNIVFKLKILQGLLTINNIEIIEKQIRDFNKLKKAESINYKASNKFLFDKKGRQLILLELVRN